MYNIARKKSDGQDWLTVMALGQKHESGTDVVIWHSPLEATSSPDHPQKRERRLRGKAQARLTQVLPNRRKITGRMAEG